MGIERSKEKGWEEALGEEGQLNGRELSTEREERGWRCGEEEIDRREEGGKEKIRRER